MDFGAIGGLFAAFHTSDAVHTPIEDRLPTVFRLAPVCDSSIRCVTIPPVHTPTLFGNYVLHALFSPILVAPFC